MYGFQITNSRGVNLIKGDEFVPCLHLKRTFPAGLERYTLDSGVPDNEPAPLVFSRGLGVAGIYAEGGKWIVSVWNASQQSELIIYLFTRAYRPPSKYGLQVFNESGRLAYQSNQKSIRVIDVVSSVHNTGLPKKYPVPVAVTSKVLFMRPTGMFRSYLYALTVDVDNVVASRVVQTIPADVGAFGQSYASFAVIDVTNL